MMRLFNNFLTFFIKKKANPKILSIFRILFFTITIIFIYRNILYFDYVYMDLQADSFLRKILYLSNYIWLITALLLLFVIETTFFKFLHWLISSTILFYNKVPAADTHLFSIISFWIIFINCSHSYLLFPSQNKSKYNYKAWGVYFLIFSTGIMFLTSGISKILDPLWLNGLGFYYFSKLNWYKPQFLEYVFSFIPNLLFYCINYLVLFFEIFILFFLLIPKIRLYGVIMLGIFFSILIFPFRIDFIGQFGLCLCVCFFSVVKINLDVK